MRYAIVFSSKTGNTKLLADTLHDSLPQDACSYFGAPDPAALDADTLYVASGRTKEPPTPRPCNFWNSFTDRRSFSSAQQALAAARAISTRS